MLRTPLPPEPLSPSQYGIGVEGGMRASQIEGMTSITIKDLFPKSPSSLFEEGKNLHRIRVLTEASLDKVDLSKIQKKDSVNILASHHSFTLYGGVPYVEMLKAIREFLQRRTGAYDIRLRVGGGLRFKEPEEIIKRFNLQEYFEGKAAAMAPIDRGIRIETNLGRVYGLRKAYDADWIVHTHNTSMREVHFHRFMDRIFKSFSMSYARLETRSSYHHNFGPRGANAIGRAIVNSELVRNKLVFSTILKYFPGSIAGVDTDEDMGRQSDRLTAECLREYGKVLNLFRKIDRCIVILDCPGPIPYASAGGLIFANFVSANIDQFDLDNPITPYSYFTEMAFDKNSVPLFGGVPEMNPAIKIVINNYSFKGYPSTFFAERVPTIVVGEKLAGLFRNCPQNSEYMSHTLLADNLKGALEFAGRVSGTDQVVIFDGARAGFNGSPSFINFLKKNAREAEKEMLLNFLPKWLKQRGIAAEKGV